MKFSGVISNGGAQCLEPGVFDHLFTTRAVKVKPGQFLVCDACCYVVEPFKEASCKPFGVIVSCNPHDWWGYDSLFVSVLCYPVVKLQVCIIVSGWFGCYASSVWIGGPARLLEAWVLCVAQGHFIHIMWCANCVIGQKSDVGRALFYACTSLHVCSISYLSIKPSINFLKGLSSLQCVA